MGTGLVIEKGVGAAPASADWRAGGFGVYVHWPFCQAKCPYCDFNSHVWREIDQARWRAALIAELQAAHATAPDRAADTVFFGGGTPSLMAPDTVAAVIGAIDGLWGLSPGAEITLEANPTSVEAGRFAGYAAAGVNRVSMGIQALNDRDLKALGRMHSVAEARAAFEIARAHFARVSFDLIYARAGQNAMAWAAELREALSMAVDHLSLYQLTIEPETRFFDLQAAGKLTTPNDDCAAEMYAATQEICDAASLPAYEVSNHAAPGAESRHNLVYWRYGDYAGVGPGAHGRLTDADGRWATQTIRDPADWLSAVETRGDGSEPRALVPPRAQAEEMLMMGLRLSEGVSLDRFRRLAGTDVPPAALSELVEGGFVHVENDRLRATAAGRPILNAVLRALLA
ncbi:MAG: radical SAM family heme chaperone HemW [Pseudomonadota bacterium]